jgi:hypothetical protein
MDQVVQVLGSLLILSAFVAAQRGWLSTQSRLYLTLNIVGASVLTVLAAHERLPGFVLLEFVWAVVAVHSLASRCCARTGWSLSRVRVEGTHGKAHRVHAGHARRRHRSGR